MLWLGDEIPIVRYYLNAYVVTQRRVWLPYFDDVDAILFLAPISCFDEHLAEDRRINRLKDSFILWKSIVGSKLLQDATIIREPNPIWILVRALIQRQWRRTVFMNKSDLLEKKLKAGVKVNKYIPRYGDKENKMMVFAKCAFRLCVYITGNSYTPP